MARVSSNLTIRTNRPCFKAGFFVSSASDAYRFMGMKLKYILAAVAVAALVFSCTKEPAAEVTAGRAVKFSVDAVFPPASEEGTKVTLGGDRLIWEGGETMAVLLGNTATSANSASLSQRSVLSDGTKGIFSGAISTGAFSAEDIKAVVVPGEPASWIRYFKGSSDTQKYMRVRIPFSATQTQSADGVLNGDNVRFFAPAALEDFTKTTDGYKIDNLQLRWACSLLRFNIYGAFDGMDGKEKLQKISLSSSSMNINYEYNLETGKNISNTAARTYTVEYSGGDLVNGRTSDTGLKVWLAIPPYTFTISGLTLETDKAVYTRSLSKKLTVTAGDILPLGINMSKFESRTAKFETPYSTDGGVSWDAEIPETFSSLAVRGQEPLTAEGLADIASRISSQSSAVELDLSRIAMAVDDGTGEPVAFPALFNGTVTAPCTKLKSIIFPSGTKAIAADAFRNCTSLESVDLTGIESIGGFAFFNTGLKALTVPNTVTSFGGNNVFGYCFDLEEVYFNSPWQSPSTGNWRLFGMRGTINAPNTGAYASADERNSGTRPLKFTFGPDGIPSRYMFDGNSKLSHIIFEGSPDFSYGDTWLIRNKSLHTVEFRSTTPPGCNISNWSTTYGVGSSALQDKKVIVPAGTIWSYSASPWNILCSNYGFNMYDTAGDDASVSRLRLTKGSAGVVAFAAYAPFYSRPVNLHYFIPSSGDISSMPELFAFHGAERGAEARLDNWKAYAQLKSFIVVAPEFTKELYPEARYQFGNVAAAGNNTANYTYYIIEKAFDYLKQNTGNTAAKYDVWGHSAGGQFTARMALMAPDARLDRIIPSNPSSYTVPFADGILPDGNIYNYPYTIKETYYADKMDETFLRHYFGLNYYVHVGELDDHQDGSMDESAAANAMGANRNARGRWFFQAMKDMAESLGYDFNWTFVEVPGSGHSSVTMISTNGTTAQGASVLLYGNR